MIDDDSSCAFCDGDISGTPLHAHGKRFCTQKHAENYAKAEAEKARSFKGY